MKISSLKNFRAKYVREKNFAEFLKKFTIVFLTQFVFATGESILLSSKVGLEPIQVLFYGMSKTFGVSYGMAINIFNFCALILVLFIYRKSLYFGTFVNAIVYGTIIDIVRPAIENLFPEQPALWLSAIGPVIGITIIGLGIALYVPLNWGITTFDALTLWFKEKTRLRYSVAFLLVNLIVTVLGYLLGSRFITEIGYGTVVSIILLGVVFEYSRKPMQFIIRKIFFLPPYVEESK